MAETRQIYQDGKNYSFTPGKNGSLTAPGPQPRQLKFDHPVAKVVPILRGMRKKTKVADANVAASRG